MYYEVNRVSDDAEWALFIHGLGGSIATWKYQMDAFKDYNILCVDLQGHGQSAFVKSGDPDSAAAHEIHGILEKEGIEFVHIISLSLGTIIAMEFTYLYPECVSSMTLAGCVLNLNFGKRMLVAFAEGIKYLLPMRVMYPIFAKIIMPKSNHTKSRKIFVRESLKMKKQAFNAWINLLSLRQKKLKTYVENINLKKLPVLFVTGKEDYLFVPGVERLKSKILNCRDSILEKCGHVCSIDKKEQFNDTVLSFLKNLQPVSRHAVIDL